MFGDQMLIAPVTAPMKGDYSTLNVWLPAGTDWYEWHTGTMLKGGQTVTRAFAIDEYPIYIKAGSILPFCDRVKSLADDDLSYVVTVFPGGDGHSNCTRIMEMIKSMIESMLVRLCSRSGSATAWK